MKSATDYDINSAPRISQIPTTTVRILLNHFKWDKEKLYEKYYTESRQEKIFEEAQLLSPFKVKEIAAKVKSASSKSPVAVFDCDICLLSLPKSVCKAWSCQDTKVFANLYCYLNLLAPMFVPIFSYGIRFYSP